MKNQTKVVTWTYFAIHAILELICFSVLFRYFRSNSALLFSAALLYDFFAFVPQGLIGELNNKFRKLNIGLIGAILLAIGVLMLRPELNTVTYIGLVILSLGNACLHEAGAIATTAVCDGKLSPSAIFVAGGSFGLIIGQTIGKSDLPLWWLFILILVIAVLVQFTNRYWLRADIVYPKVRITNEKAGFWLVLLVAFLVVTARSFIGYAIPMTWKTEVWQGFLLFFVMGLGKGLGGWLSDRFGARLIGVSSTLLSIPFLIIGKDVMVISVIGVFLFSLTMSITFGMLLSVMDDDPGLAFGITTIGLAIGLVPVFVFGSFSFTVNCILVIILSLASAVGLARTLK